MGYDNLIDRRGDVSVNNPYSLSMTDLQRDFYHALLAPFKPEELSEVPARGGNKMLTYVDKRAIENRLDTACGPAGWYP